ncbi:MAG: hypothetical protein MJ160_04885 [Treponema sp.]|nr:hypothetical protein [Treponema sp.]
MAKHSAFSLGRIFLQFALGAMLIIGGIWALMGGGDFGANAIRALTKGNMEKILVIVFGFIELLAGAFLILEFFFGDFLKSFDVILKLIIIIVWIVAIVLSDFLNANFGNFIPWLYGLATHLIVLGALLCLKD